MSHDTRQLGPRSTLPFVERQALPTLPWEVRLVIATTGEHLIFQVKDWVTLGRTTSERYTQNHIDLTPHAAVELGVSRIHAAIHARRSFITVQDLSSTNGTQLNGYALAPYQNVALQDNDELILGALKLRIHFVMTPDDGTAPLSLERIDDDDDDSAETRSISQDSPAQRS